MTPEELRSLIHAGDRAQVVAAFSPLPEQVRRQLGDIALYELKAVTKAKLALGAAEGPRSSSIAAEEQEAAARAAVFWTCSAAQFGVFAKKRWLGITDAELLLEVRPSWLDEAAERALEGNVGSVPFARHLVRRGVSKPPSGEHFAVWAYSRDFVPWENHRPLADNLLDDPRFLEEDVWKIFEVEGGGEFSLAAHDKFSHGDGTWAVALVTLMEAGHLSRPRLLDASLDALARDFAAFRAGWYSRFHELLSPTVEERTARLGTYLRLLGSTIPATVSLALGALAQIDAASAIASNVLLSHLPPALSGRHKATATSALQLLAAVAQRDPDAREEVAHAAVVALAHEAADVQKIALGLVTRFGPPENSPLQAKVKAKGALLAPSVARELRVAHPSAGSGNVVLQVTKARPRLPALDPSRKLSPVRTLDEAIDLVAHVLETGDDPDDVELALDAVARLSGERPSDFEKRMAPLRKRAKVVREKRRGHAAYEVAAVALGFTGAAGPSVESTKDITRPTLLLRKRAARVAAAAFAGKPLLLLATPTHRGGWIEPGVLVSRTLSSHESHGIDVTEGALSLLRLAREGRESALEQAATAKGEFGDALRYALGGDAPIGPTASFWVAAARAREPRADDAAILAAHPGLGPDAAEVAQYSWSVTSRESDGHTFHTLTVETTPKAHRTISLELPSMLCHSDYWGEKSIVRWLATVWPAGTESYFARGAAAIGNNLDFSEANWSNAVPLEVLNAPSTDFGPMALLLLALGLAAKEPGEKGLAIDAAIGAIADGRVTGARLGEPMARLLPSGLVTVGRWTKTLAVVAAVSPLHAREVSVAIQRSLRGDQGEGPRDLGALILLMRELLISLDAKVSDPEAWACLSAGRYRTKLKDIAP